MLKVAKYCAQNNKTYCLNLSAPFLCQFFKGDPTVNVAPTMAQLCDLADQMSSILPFTDIIFGNEDEAAAYAKENNLGTTEVAEIALKLAMLPKENGSKSRLVIITQGEGENIAANKAQFLILSTQDPW